jgi:hypothetical protein
MSLAETITCYKCGRIGIRMEEARAEGRNLSVKQELK